MSWDICYHAILLRWSHDGADTIATVCLNTFAIYVLRFVQYMKWTKFRKSKYSLMLGKLISIHLPCHLCHPCHSCHTCQPHCGITFRVSNFKCQHAIIDYESCTSKLSVDAKETQFYIKTLGVWSFIHTVTILSMQINSAAVQIFMLTNLTSTKLTL